MRIRRIRIRQLCVQMGLVVFVIAFAGCDSAVDAKLSFNENKTAELSVQVDLDSEISERLGNVDDLRLDGLKDKGWSVGSEAQTDGVTLRADYLCKSATACVNALDATGLFTETSVAWNPNRSATEVKFSTVIDLSNGLAVFGVDPSVVSSESIKEIYGVEPSEAIRFRVSVDTKNSGSIVTNGSVAGESVEWSPKLGDRTEVRYQANLGADAKQQAWMVVAALCAAALVLLLFSVFVGRKRRHTRKSGRDPKQKHAPVDEEQLAKHARPVD